MKLLICCVKHFVTIIKHKYFVMIECFKLGLYWQGITHDLSKFSLAEFIQSAKYFQGNCTPVNKIRNELGYSTAWLHHKGRNKHHCEYWIDFVDGKPKYCSIPKKYLKEMFCDLIGASKAYSKNKFNPKEPLEYYYKNKHKFLMTDSDKEFLENLLKGIAGYTNEISK